MTIVPRLLSMLVLATVAVTTRASEPVKLLLWSGEPPGETRRLPPEKDLYKLSDRKIAGRSIIKLTNVSTPTLEVSSMLLTRPTVFAIRSLAISTVIGEQHLRSSLGLPQREPAREYTRRMRPDRGQATASRDGISRRHRATASRSSDANRTARSSPSKRAPLASGGDSGPRPRFASPR